MLYNYLIFLCIGVYASCIPITNETERIRRLKIGIQEIQKNFCEIKKELHNHLENSQEIPLYITTNREKPCVRENLKAYIRFLNQLSVRISHENMTTHYKNMLKTLELVNKKWISQDDQKCETTPESNSEFTENLYNFLLRDLPSVFDLKETICPGLQK